MNLAAVTDLFALTDRELWLVTARHGERRGGLIATFVSQASIVPELPRVLVGVARQHHTWELIEASAAFALHLLTEENFDWVERFGMRSGRAGDKFEGLTVESAVTGSPILPASLGWLDCRVETKMNTGDRTVYLAEVVEAAMVQEAAPVTLRRVLQRATSEQRRELKEQMTRDAAVDAAAIRAWRQTRISS